MKRIVYLLVSATVFGAIGWMSLEVAQTVRARKVAARSIRTLPDVKLRTLQGGTLALTDATSLGTVVLFFTTTCPYCRDEIEDLLTESKHFEHARVILISGEPPSTVAAYVTDLEVYARSTFTVALDSGHVLARRFGIRGIPTTFVYSPQGSLLGRYDGVVRARTILKNLEDRPDDVVPVAWHGLWDEHSQFVARQMGR